MNRLLSANIFRNAAAAAFLVLLSTACAAVTGDAEKISQLLRQAKTDAVQTANDALQLETYSMANIPWQVHYYRLVATGDGVNALVKDWKQLQQLRDKATPEQQAVIDQLGELLNGLAIRVNAARHYLAQNPNEVNMPTFHDQIRANNTDIQNASLAVCQCASKARQLLTAKVDKNSGPDCPAAPTKGR
ncbi:hypothetical protein [Occallatibacter riparius]|uniref:Uncharacterized protein n=1 Tax=Occallatibacter riparius TaxID=1002689 RepID=A0A9J7BR50_9BACT|nr:hypothetical protein [Occallatibacter riparius]UWZ85299.1 hypothetical protein MOP44_05005 [Occallatibacter riparius]